MNTSATVLTRLQRGLSGAPRGIRTHDPRFRSLMSILAKTALEAKSAASGNGRKPLIEPESATGSHYLPAFRCQNVAIFPSGLHPFKVREGGRRRGGQPANRSRARPGRGRGLSVFGFVRFSEAKVRGHLSALFSFAILASPKAFSESGQP